MATKKQTKSSLKPTTEKSKKAAADKKAKPAPGAKTIAAKSTIEKKGSKVNKVEVKTSKTVDNKKSKKAIPETKTVAKKPIAKKAPEKAPEKVVAAKKAAPSKAPAPAAVKAKAPVEKQPAAAKPAPKKKETPAKPAASKSHAKAVASTVKTLPLKSLATTVTRPTPTPVVRIQEKKPNVIIAHRRIENRQMNGDDSGKTMINYQPDTYRSVLDEPKQNTGPVYRYSDEELVEFKDLIGSRLDAARKELLYLQGLITRKDEAGTEDTENRYMNMEDGSGAMEREQLAQLASRQIQFMSHLEKALVRIENKTYGICRVTGKLIDKARLRAVPHATLSIEAKNMMANK
jgi:RNA polymerase-binding transcription factor DksA